MAESGGLFVNDFETGDMTQWTSVTEEGSNTFVASATALNHGSYGGLLTFDGTNNDCYAIKNLVSAENDVYWRAYFLFPAALSWSATQYPTILELKDGATRIARLRLVCTGTDIKLNRIYYYDNTGSHVINLPVTTLARDTQYRFELRYKSGAGDGVVEAWLDGASQGSATNLTNNNYTVDKCRAGSDAVVYEANDTFFVDDCKAATTGPIGAYSDAGGANAPTGVLYGSLVGPMGGPL